MARSATHSALTPVLSSSASSLIFALLPKCPACLVLLLTPLGIRLPGSRWFLIYAIMAMAAIPLVFFWTASCRKSIGLRPMFLAMAGLMSMTLGRVLFDSTILIVVGVLALFRAAFWTARSATRKPAITSCGVAYSGRSRLSGG